MIKNPDNYCKNFCTGKLGWNFTKRQQCRKETPCLDFQQLNIQKTCLWTYQDIEDYWDTECQKAFTISEGTPKENGFKFCPFCGKVIQERTCRGGKEK